MWSFTHTWLKPSSSAWIAARVIDPGLAACPSWGSVTATSMAMRRENLLCVSMELEQVDVVSDGPVTRVVLDRPERRNALEPRPDARSDRRARRGFPTTARSSCSKPPDPRSQPGTTSPRWCARDDEFYDELFAVCTDLMLRLHELPQPVMAKVQGVATAAGCQLVAACDLAVAADTATFATPGVRIGLFCSTPMVPLTRAIGRKRALQMLLTGEPIDAPTALDWGLVNQVVPAAELDPAPSTRCSARSSASAPG